MYVIWMLIANVVGVVQSANTLYNQSVSGATRTDARDLGLRRQIETELRQLTRTVTGDTASETASELLPLVRVLAPALERERVFGLKANGLRRLLLASNALGTKSAPTAAALLNCDNSDSTAFATAVFRCLEYLPTRPSLPLTISRLDSLLHELASFSGFSVDEFGVQLKKSQRVQQQVISDLFRGRTALEARFITQVILKVPVSPFHESWALAIFHPSFWRIYKFQPNLRAACRAIELERSASALKEINGNQRQHQPTQLQVGVNLANMALTKATSCAHVIRHMQSQGETEFVAEVKYDGERNQIHFNANATDHEKRITLYSKSKRNSTSDRILCHDIVLATLGIKESNQPNIKPTLDSSKQYTPVTSAIFDSEILVFNESTQSVEPFHEARAFASEKSRSTNHDILTTQKHYLLVFFDIMYLNGESLLSLPYVQRREILEQVIRPIPNYSAVSETRRFQLQLDPDEACTQLRKYFLQVCARPAEGLVCKGVSGRYEPGRDSLWMKLKKDYIAGFGDTADFVVLGGSYRHDLTDYLGITRKDDSGLLNIYFVGAQLNRGVQGEPPHYVILFDFCAGFSRDSLLFFSKSTTPIRHPTPKTLSYTLHQSTPTSKIESFFDPPLTVELKGGGFENRNGRWALRGPRYIRTCGPDRGWWDAVTYQEFSAMAVKSTKPSQWDLEYDKLAAVDAQVSAKLVRKRSSTLSSVGSRRSSFSCGMGKRRMSEVSSVGQAVPVVVDDLFDIAELVYWQNPSLASIRRENVSSALMYIPGTRNAGIAETTWYNQCAR
ncbi:DNA ligase/mRNA capping enzyme [Rhizoclosmatium globosum]|uniref:DNA ligase/mRNA capping enzyme n=1 Tax=Rhizoclosmatium globosum TaxID=329046 RepID=A0A1Y2CWZ8_9FUNG|nr:DNA ligase/mRNA capping enzyme [Rhizoclosmatium globosum]|eukprot:ORY50865.1 DNA ligase/mRNA capping enzyme [Rhizoclosmatium globosum]